MTQAGSQTEALSETRANRMPRATRTRWRSMPKRRWMPACASSLERRLD